MKALLDDLRWILRTWRRRPAFPLAAGLTFALGLGAAGAVFTLLYALVLKPLPYPDGDRLVRVTSTLDNAGAVEEVPCSYLDFADWREGQHAVVDLVARTGPRSFNLLTAGEAEHVEGEMATAGYFRLLGAEPALGRAFTAGEHGPASGTRVVVLSDALWRRRFAADRDVVGGDLLINGESYRIVGVAPPGFRGLSQQAEIFLPLSAARQLLAPYYLDSRSFRWLSTVGRLADGVELPVARDALAAVASALARDQPETNRHFGIALGSLHEELLGRFGSPLRVLQAAALAVLLVAATNVAGLLLARGRERGGETGLRAALGESPWRSAGRTLGESVLLAFVGCAVALPCIFLAPRVLLVAGAVELPTFARLRPTVAVCAIAAGAALLCGLLFGLPAAWRAGRRATGSGLRPGGSGTTAGGRRRGSGALIAVQIAFTVLLLVGCGLLIEDTGRRLSRDLGFDPVGILTLRLDLKGSRYADDEAVWAFASRLLDEARSAAGIRSAALAGPGVPTDDWNGTFATLEHPLPSEDDDLLVLQHFVTPGYFATLHVPLVAGRLFDDRDRDGAPRTVVVSEGLSRRLWPGREALGERLKLGPLWLDPPWLTVIGVVPHVAHEGPAGETRPAEDLYLPFFQSPPRSPPIVNLLVRGEAATVAATADLIRNRVHRLDATLPVYDAATLDQRFARQLITRRFVLLLLALFALLTFGLASVGIHGAVSGELARRRKEIAILKALGATPRDIVVQMLRTTVVAALTGLIAGAAAGLLWLPGALQGLLPGAVDDAGSELWGAALALLALVALAAAVVPTLRALAIDPARLLREPEA